MMNTSLSRRQKFLIQMSCAAPIIAIILCATPFVLGDEFVEMGLDYLEKLNPPQFLHYARTLENLGDGKARLVSTYIAFASAVVLIPSASILVFLVLNPARKHSLNYTIGSMITRIIFAVFMSYILSSVVIWNLGQDMELTKVIPNTLGIKSSFIATLELWGLGSIIGLSISEILDFIRRVK